ncbi:three-helix bundle dimerization domain-containing protein [Agromyces sp. GXQ0307]|uniref:three-helix bundle dimerization domain-containing protein n=1 Tax=Agromyces sp. GXQ0307 TaxID=3377835 RepID=UPI00383B70D5
MTTEADEQQAVEHVVTRLLERFPSLAEDHIHAIVDEEHHRFDGRPVRDFVPVLVERAARQRLATEAPIVRVDPDAAELAAADQVRRTGGAEADPMEVARRSEADGGDFLFGDLGGRAS